jgi:hypothetical protein
MQKIELNAKTAIHCLLKKSRLCKHSRRFSFTLSNYSSSNLLTTKSNNRKILSITLISVALVSVFMLCITSGAVVSNSTIHMSGTIAYISPTSTPIPTPTLPPTGNTINLAPLSAWSYLPYASKYTYPVTWEGQTAIKFTDYGPPYAGPNGGVDRELDAPYVSVKAGDIVVFKALLWTEASNIGDTSSYHGADIEIDAFNGNNRICAVNNNNGVGTGDYNNGVWAPYAVIPWGSGKWVQLSMTWTVPNTLQSDGYNGANGYSLGTVVQPNRFGAIIQAFSSNPGAETAAVYICGTELYVNP